MLSKHAKSSDSSAESSPSFHQALDPGDLMMQDRIRPFSPKVVRGRQSPHPGPSTPDTSRPRSLNVRPAFYISSSEVQTSDSSPEDIEIRGRPHNSEPSPMLLQLQDVRERFQLSPDISGIGSPVTRPTQPVRKAASLATIPDTARNLRAALNTWESDLSDEASSGFAPPSCCSFIQAAASNYRHNLTNWISAKTKKDLDREEVFEYLDEHLSFTHEYVLKVMSLEELEYLYLKKLEMELETRSASEREARWADFGNSEFLALIRDLRKEHNEEDFIMKLAQYVNVALQGNAFKVYKICNGSTEDIVKVFTFDGLEDKIVLVDSKPHAQVFEATRRATCMHATRISEPLQFSSSSNCVFHIINKTDVLSYAMVVPILVENGEVSHIIEVWRSYCYQQTDVLIADSFMVWGSLATHCYTIMTEKKKESELTDFLLMTVKSIFEEMVSLDHVIKRILQFAQKLVDADRASLFLVDYKNSELVSTVFDLKLSNANDQDLKEKKEIRMPITRGIAGHVAITGDHVNISDAYSDKRFNREVDEATGYKTTSILCMPVKIEGIIIGVVQMVNKREAEKFSHEDVKSFKIFASFFGLALHNARLYDKITRKEQKYRVALEVLSYHNTCREEEVKELALFKSNKVPITLSDYYMDPFALNLIQKCQSAMIMFDDLFNMKNFDNLNVTRFILTVKKNYRDVPYHNFHHGWSVAQTMYAILKTDASKHFSFTQRLALFVASLCHDLDHRGYTNKYMSETASPLAAMYTTSTLEHHHFNITVTILQQDGHNIFSRFTSKDYKDILGLIRTCILATDLAAFFPNLVQMKQLCCTDNWAYNWEDRRHGELAMAMSMTAADLSASAKPWDVQNKTVKVIFEEFYSQGDKERAAGRTPIPMMDRNKPEEQPASQVGFLTQICLPCYQILKKILPTTADLHKMACNNLKIWEHKAEEVAKLAAKQMQPEQRELSEQNDLQNKGVPLEKFSLDQNEPGTSGIQNTEVGEIIPWDEEVDVSVINQEITSVVTINEKECFEADVVSANDTINKIKNDK